MIMSRKASSRCSRPWRRTSRRSAAAAARACWWSTTWSTPARPPRWCAISCPRRISPPSMPSRWGARWSTRSSPRYRRTPGSSFPGTPDWRSSRRSATAPRDPGSDCGTSCANWRSIPMPDTDEAFEDDPAAAAFVEDFERHRDAIYELVCDYMEDVEISESYVAQLLVDAMIRMRMTAYGMGVESPSVAGLKLDLDRLRDEVGVFLREAKKGAEEYIALVKEMRADAEAALEAEEKDEEEGEEGEADKDG